MSGPRWQPPPMQAAASEAKPAVTVDERVVRKMLKVNPELRKGRTTIQVKRALERGEAVGAGTDSASAAPAAVVPSPAAPSTRTELAETVAFFVRGKGERLEARLAEVEARRRALDDEAARARSEARAQVIAFVALLDEAEVAANGRAILEQHQAFLRQLDLTPATLIQEALRRRS